jgi:cytochrome c oxidase subunit IV
MTAHTLSLKAYFGVFGTLALLTIATTAVAYIDLGFFNVIAALTIAVSKALLVVLFFMHLAQSRHRTQVVAGAGILWLLILITFTLSDVLTRSWIAQPTGW